ncbi:hypothetical protein AX14_005854 [Amanita brunnescens Koide BX004]|nr:hypothetical protein AX14_005854 [Amanita brunnescens Koide BX004]
MRLYHSLIISLLFACALHVFAAPLPSESGLSNGKKSVRFSLKEFKDPVFPGQGSTEDAGSAPAQQPPAEEESAQKLAEETPAQKPAGEMPAPKKQKLQHGSGRRR